MLRFCLAAALLGATAVPVAAADTPSRPTPHKHQITGLFAPDRVDDLKTTFAKLPGYKLLGVDYDAAEAVIEYDPAKLYPNNDTKKNPHELVPLLNNVLGPASDYTFTVKPLRTTPREKLALIEFRVEGLDCKGCAFEAYSMVTRVPGVETATVSFKVGKITALVDPTKVTRADLEKVLKDGGVDVKPAK